MSSNIFLGVTSQGKFSYNYLTDVLSIGNGGIDAFYLDNTGNVGIGTTTPSVNLEVNGDILMTSNDLSVSSAASNGQFRINNNFGSGRVLMRDTANLISIGDIDDSGEVAFFANDIERMRIGISGNVGIGTNNPDRFLHVRQDTNDAVMIEVENLGTGTAAEARVQAQGASGQIYMASLDDEYTTSGAEIQDGAILSSGTGNTGGLALRSQATTGDMTFWTGGDNERMRILSTGEVGIGTVAPESTLHISSGVGANGDCVLFLQADTDNDAGFDDSNSYILFGQDGQTFATADGAVGKGIDGSNNMFITNGDGSIVFETNGSTALNGTERMRIDRTTGNVGINETSPDELLHISDGHVTGNGIPTIRLENTEQSGSHPQAEFSSIDFWKSDGNTAMARIVCYNDVGGTNPDGSLRFYTSVNSASTLTMTHSSGGNLTITGVYSPFTGSHRTKSDDIEVGINEYVGLIASSVGRVGELTINDSIISVQLSNTDNDKRVYGVVSHLTDDHNAENHIMVNSVGEGGIWVCDINGEIENGDFITSCEVLGYGKLQDDDLQHNYTVAKITEDSNFIDMDVDVNYRRWVKLDGEVIDESEYDAMISINPSSAYKAKFVSCTYHCG